MVLSTVTTHTIAGTTFRCSEWTAGHLTSTIARLKIAHPGATLVILQPCYHAGVDASKFTHDYDCVLDVEIRGLDWWEAQKFLRNCGWAAWFRHQGTWAPKSMWHIHMCSVPRGLTTRPSAPEVGAAYKALGLKVGLYIDGGLTSTGHTTATSQIVDYFNHAQGLASQHRPGCDTSWFPPSIAATIYNPEAARVAAGQPTYLDITVALARLAENSSNPKAKPIYLRARTIIGKLVRDGRRVRVPESTADVIAVLAAKRAATKNYWAKYRLTTVIRILRPLA